MRNNCITMLTALAVLLMGLPILGAQAGNGAPSKYNYQINQISSQNTGHTTRVAGNHTVPITEFSSSSAPTSAHGPKR